MYLSSSCHAIWSSLITQEADVHVKGVPYDVTSDTEISTTPWELFVDKNINMATPR